jgi:Uma2 family endonuclease
MASVTTGLMTAEGFWEWASRPENADRRWELVKGEVVEVPSPAEFHGILCSWIVHLLWGYVLRRGRGGVSSNDTGLLVEHDPDTVRGPDVMVFEESRPLDQLSRRFSTRVPVLVVEVLSPSDRMPRMTARIGEFLRRGVPIVWLVDAETRTVTVYRLDHYPQVLDENDELTGEFTPPDCTLRVAELFNLPASAPQKEPS